MKRFSDFAKEDLPLDGKKLRIDEVVNREIKIIGHKITGSKYNKSNSSECLTLHFEMDGENFILFTGSSILIEQTVKYKDEIPFLTTIKKVDKYYTFS